MVGRFARPRDNIPTQNTADPGHYETNNVKDFVQRPISPARQPSEYRRSMPERTTTDPEFKTSSFKKTHTAEIAKAGSPAHSQRPLQRSAGLSPSDAEQYTSTQRSTFSRTAAGLQTRSGEHTPSDSGISPRPRSPSRSQDMSTNSGIARAGSNASRPYNKQRIDRYFKDKGATHARDSIANDVIYGPRTPRAEVSPAVRSPAKAASPSPAPEGFTTTHRSSFSAQRADLPGKSRYQQPASPNRSGVTLGTDHYESVAKQNFRDKSGSPMNAIDRSRYVQTMVKTSVDSSSHYQTSQRADYRAWN